MQIKTNRLAEVTILKTVSSQLEVSNEKPRILFFKNLESKNQGLMHSYRS